MTTDTETLRAQVPDDPIKLPADHLACEGCGIAVPEAGPRPFAFSEKEHMAMRMPKIPRRPRFGRCSECSARRDAADAYVTERPALVARHGTVINEQIESVLMALAVLGQPVPADLGFLLSRMQPVGHGLRFRNPTPELPGRCSPYPWAHVSLTQRAELRTAHAGVMRDRIALREPPVRVPCPTRACLMCGIAAVERSSIEVLRRGGVQASVLALWRKTGPGHTCPSCAEAIQAEGAVGPSAMTRALLNHVLTLDVRKAGRLRQHLQAESVPLPAPWSALRNAKPNIMRFGHLRRLIDNL